MEEPNTEECDLQNVNSLAHSDCQVITKTSQLDDEPEPEQASENHQNESGTSPRPTKSEEEEAENEKPCKEDSPASNATVNSEYQVITKTSELEAETADSEHQLELSANNTEASKPEESAERKGGYDYNLVSGKLPEGLENCTICHMIPRKPAKVPCCGYVFCQSCIISHSQESNRCPLCREKLNTEHIQIVDKHCERRIMNLVVHCVNQSLGCDWTGELKDVGSHIKNTCEYQVTECEFKFAGCDFEGPKRLMFKHIQEDVSNHMSRMARSITRGRAELDHLRSECADLKSRSRFYQCLVGVLLVIAIILSLSAILFSAKITTKVAENEQALQNLERDIDDHIALFELDSSEMKSKLSECVHDLKILKLTVKKVEWDIADLKTSFVIRLNDAVSKAICTIIPRQITNLLQICPS